LAAGLTGARNPSFVALAHNTFSFLGGVMGGAVAFGYHVASRLAYVLGVGIALRREARHGATGERGGAARRFRRFRAFASVLMVNDVASFGVLCVVTWHPLARDLPSTLLLALGLILIFCGVATKAWAARRLGGKAYYWYDFFEPGQVKAPYPPGPYRFLKNPMYTVGYLPAYGLGLVCRSVPGLIAAAFDQAAILIFYRLVEKPHFDRLVQLSVRSTGIPGVERIG
jgi:protein-S-isoprenylcysteine O-methyltransferase Ste14